MGETEKIEYWSLKEVALHTNIPLKTIQRYIEKHNPYIGSQKSGSRPRVVPSDKVGVISYIRDLYTENKLSQVEVDLNLAETYSTKMVEQVKEEKPEEPRMSDVLNYIKLQNEQITKMAQHITNMGEKIITMEKNQAVMIESREHKEALEQKNAMLETELEKKDKQLLEKDTELAEKEKAEKTLSQEVDFWKQSGNGSKIEKERALERAVKAELEREASEERAVKAELEKVAADNREQKIREKADESEREQQEEKKKIREEAEKKAQAQQEEIKKMKESQPKNFREKLKALFIQE